jgi:hypothetical protein
VYRSFLEMTTSNFYIALILEAWLSLTGLMRNQCLPKKMVSGDHKVSYIKMTFKVNTIEVIIQETLPDDKSNPQNTVVAPFSHCVSSCTCPLLSPLMLPLEIQININTYILASLILSNTAAPKHMGNLILQPDLLPSIML